MKTRADRLILLSGLISGIGMFVAYLAGRSEARNKQKQAEAETWKNATHLDVDP